MATVSTSIPTVDPEWKLTATKDHAQKVLKLLEGKDQSRVVLVGGPGIGKTWMARKISELSMSSGSRYGTLWISLDKKHDQKSLYESIACQLSLPTATDDWEDDDENERQEDNVQDSKEMGQSIKEKIIVKLIELREENTAADSKVRLEEATEAVKKRKSEDSKTNKYLLLILDGDGKVMDEQIIMEDLGLKNVLQESKFWGLKDDFPDSHLKIIITRSKVQATTGSMVEVLPPSPDDALSLLREHVGERISDSDCFGKLFEAIVKGSRTPAEIIMIGRALNYAASCGDWDRVVEHALELATDLAALFSYVYDTLSGDCLNCFWHSWNFLHKNGGLHYNELITQWILEGYCNPVDHIGKAYDKGHHILMELIDRGLLKMQEDSVVVLEGAILSKGHYQNQRFPKVPSLGLPCLLEDDCWKGLGRIVPADGMIKSVRGGEVPTISTLLVDGSRLCREIPEPFFEGRQSLEVLAIFDPRIKIPPFSSSKMENLLVLVLRGSYLLETTIHIEKFKALTILEISGASSLKKIPDQFFVGITQLRSLNFSALGITLLPSSISKLIDLRSLILRQCSFLEALPKLGGLTKLEVLDLSDCTSLMKIHDKSFGSLSELKLLDISRTKIAKVPFVRFRKHLAQLLLKGCNNLCILPSLQELPNLKILDLSGAEKLEEIKYDCFEKTEKLNVLDLSGTKIRFLPLKFDELCDLKLKSCHEFTVLPSTEALKHLESLDLSNSSGLEQFEDESFKHLERLCYLNFSQTKIGTLPPFGESCNLRQLLLKGCLYLKCLPEMRGLSGLEVLDLSDCDKLDKLPLMTGLRNLKVLNLSGCKSLSEIQGNLFEQTTMLQELNLSGTLIKFVPSLQNCGNLQSLVLTNCSNLESLPDFTSLSKLKELDLDFVSKIECSSLSHIIMPQLEILKLVKIRIDEPSAVFSLTNLRVLSLKDCLGTLKEPRLEAFRELETLVLSEEAIESLPPLDNLSKLRKLSLSGCKKIKKLPSLKSLIHLEILDLSQTGIQRLPDEMSALTCLEHLYLPDLKLLQEVGWEKIERLPREINWDQCSVSGPSTILWDHNKPCLVFNGITFFSRLKADQKLLEAFYNLFKQVIFSIRSTARQSNIGEICLSDVYFKSKLFPASKEKNGTSLSCGDFLTHVDDGKSLEIYGFDDFPTDIKEILKQAEYVSLSETCLSKLRLLELENMKGCWLERCTETESFLNIEMNQELGQRLETLWFSNLPKLTSLHLDSFKNLKRLYVDCCPNMKTLFYSVQPPENLETLIVKFCDGLETLFEEKESTNFKLSKLRKLHLLELPKLVSIGASLQLPEALESLKIEFCDKLQSLFGHEESSDTELLNLQTLHLIELPELISIGFKYGQQVNAKIKLAESKEIHTSGNSSDSFS